MFERGSFHLAVQTLWPLLMLPFAFLLAWFGYRRTAPPLGGRDRTLFVLLRTLAFFTLLLILASPVLNLQRNEPLRAHIAVLMDESASMSTQEGSGSQRTPRLARAREALRSLVDVLRGDDVEVAHVAGEALEHAGERLGQLRQQRAAHLGPQRDGAGDLESIDQGGGGLLDHLVKRAVAQDQPRARLGVALARMEVEDLADRSRPPVGPLDLEREPRLLRLREHVEDVEGLAEHLDVVDVRLGGLPRGRYRAIARENRLATLRIASAICRTCSSS